MMDTVRRTIPKPIRLIPQLLAIIFFVIEVFLTLDAGSFLLSFAWPIPYKDAFYEDFLFFRIAYAVLILLICILSLIRPKLAAIPVPLIVMFEIYALVSPIIYKALYYSLEQAGRYALSIFDPTSSTFYLHTVKSFIVIAIAVMLFICLLNGKAKITLILLSVSVILAVFTVVPLVLEMNTLYASGTLDNVQYGKLGKSVLVGIFRVAPLLPLFLSGIYSKNKA